MITGLVVALCVFIGVLSVIDLGADNPVEKEAEAIITQETGATVNMDSLAQDLETAKTTIDAVKATDAAKAAAGKTATSTKQ